MDDNEKISAMLIRHIKQERGSLSNDEATEAIAWIEKQTEKSSKWSEEDEKMVNDIIAAIDTLYYHGMVNWLKGLKSRI